MHNISLKNKYTIRKAEPKDYEAINDAYNKFTGQCRTMEQYLWQWVNTPFEPSEIWAIENNETKEIVGHHGVMYLPFKERGELIAVGKTENTFVDKMHARNLFYLGIEKQAFKHYRDRFDYIFTFTPQVSGGAPGMIRKRLGYSSVGKLATFCLNLNFSGARFYIKDRFAYLEIIASPLAAGYRIAKRFINMLNYRKAWQIEITSLPVSRMSEVGEFWEKNCKYYGITADRTPGYLKWRYADNPYYQYSLWMFHNQGDILGYAITTKAKLHGIMESLNIVDLVVSNFSEDNVYLALTTLTKKFPDANIFMTALLQDDSLNRAFQRFQKLLKRWHVQTITELLAWSKSSRSCPWYITYIFNER